jgi:glycosyltransferase involved in cell wall biosynthesis
MHIGIDATCWQNTRGYGRYTRALLSTLVRIDINNQYIFFIDSKENIHINSPNVTLHFVQSALPASSAAAVNSHRSLYDLWNMSRALSVPDIDVLLFPTVYTYVPVITKAKKLVGIHDVIPEMYPQLTLPNRSARWFWKVKVALGIWQADAIVTVSKYSRKEIASFFNISPERIHVVGEANDPVFRVLENHQISPCLLKAGISADGRKIIYIGGFGPHKNLESLVAVFSKLARQEEFYDLRLIMVGEFRQEVFFSQYDTLIQQLKELGISNKVIFTGYLPDEELVELLNISTVLVLPSLMEGFGLPAVEAAACGCPVIATKESPLPDLLGTGGLYIDPARLNDLEHALRCVLSSPELRQQMRKAGLNAVRGLSWESAAIQMKGIIEKVVNS